MAAFKLLRKSTDIQGLLNTECVAGLNYAIKSGLFLQIVHIPRPLHWVLVQGTAENTKHTVNVYDSLYLEPLSGLREQVAALLRAPSFLFKITYVWCPKQLDGFSCGIHAIANATEIIFNQTSYSQENWSWNIKEMRKHFTTCLENGLMTPFPKKRINNPRQVPSTSSFEIEIFCICRQPDLSESIYLPKRGYLNWIQCTNVNCKNWFHNQCVGILDKDLEKWDGKKFICPQCSEGICL